MAGMIGKVFRFVATVLALGYGLHAWAVVAPLPGVSPQTTVAGSTFEQRIAVRVTRADGSPVANVRITWQHFDLASISFGGEGCQRAVTLLYCHATTKADGIADLGQAYSWWAATERVTVTADNELGSTVIELTAVPIGPTATIALVAGDGQRAAVGSRYAAPIEVRVLRPDGTPAVGVSVAFGFEWLRRPVVRFDPERPATAITDANGIARSPPMVAVEGVGTIAGVARYSDAATKSTVSANFTLTNTTADGRAYISYQDMWWSGPAENGWGMSIAQIAENLFGVLFAYDDTGEPTWWVLPSGGWSSGFASTYGGRLYQPVGTPYFAYDATRFELGREGMTLFLDFRGGEHSATAHVEDWRDPMRPDDIRFSKTLTRMDFTMDMPMALTGVGGLWWGGPSQSGWGLSIMEQRGHLFCVWLTYGADGKPTWFVMPSGAWDGTAWTGAIYRTRSSPWFGKSYDASQFRLTQVGSYRIEFGSTQSATFRWTVGEHSGAVPIMKQDFGP